MLDINDILNLDKRYRTNLINSLSGFKNANLIGTASKKGENNLAIFSSIVHIGANPPLLGMISRPHTVPRHTLENIIATGYYTINHVHQDFIKESHQTAASYEGSEFEEVGLTTEFIPDFTAPFVKESAIKMGLELQEIIDIKLNGTKLIIGKIVKLIVPKMYIASDGKLDIEQAGTVAISGLDTYHATTQLARFSYAKPDALLSLIER